MLSVSFLLNNILQWTSLSAKCGTQSWNKGLALLYLYLPGNSRIMAHIKRPSLLLLTLAYTFTINSRFTPRNIKWHGNSVWRISYGLHCPEYETRSEKDIFYWSRTSSQAPIEWVPEVKPRASATEINNEWSYTAIPAIRIHVTVRKTLTFYHWISAINISI